MAYITESSPQASAMYSAQKAYKEAYDIANRKVQHGIEITPNEANQLYALYQRAGQAAVATGWSIGSTGVMPSPESLGAGISNSMQLQIINQIINTAVAQAGSVFDAAESQYRQILGDIEAYGVKVDEIWDSLSAEVKQVLAQSAEKQRTEVETGYGAAKGLLTKEIEDLTADYQKAMGYYDNLLKTGIADPQGRIRQVRNELETNFKTYLGDVMDMASRKGVQGQTMLSSMPKTQEAFFKSMIPIVSQQQELAYGAGERIAGAQAGLETGKAGQRGALTGQLAGLETWKGGALANIEAQRGAGEVNVLGQAASGKATGYQDIMGKQMTVAGNLLNLATPRAALPMEGANMMVSAIKAQPTGTQSVYANTLGSAVPGSNVYGNEKPSSGETYQQWLDRIKNKRLATKNPAWTSYYG